MSQTTLYHRLSTYYLFFVLVIIAPIPSASATGILPPPEKISDHVYAWIGPLEGPSEKNHGYRMNMAFIVGEQFVAVIDTGYTTEMAHEMVSYIRKTTELPIRYAINTNSQPHRYMGNDVFRQLGAETIAHIDSAKRMEGMGSQFATAIEFILKKKASKVTLPQPPSRVIDSDITLDLGALEIKIRYMGAGHTPAQLIVEIPQDNLIYAGDLLYSERLLAILSDSNIRSWITAYDKLAGFGDVLFIPGHGKPAKLEMFSHPTRSYLALVDKHMIQAVEEMMELQDAINTLDQKNYKDLTNFEQLSGRNASWAYLYYESNAM